MFSYKLVIPASGETIWIVILCTSAFREILKIFEKRYMYTQSEAIVNDRYWLLLRVECTAIQSFCSRSRCMEGLSSTASSPSLRSLRIAVSYTQSEAIVNDRSRSWNMSGRLLQIDIGFAPGKGGGTLSMHWNLNSIWFQCQVHFG